MRPIVGAGTPEQRWQEWGALAQLPELLLEQGPPPLVVAPHPDDEILGAAGLLAVAGGGGRRGDRRGGVAPGLVGGRPPPARAGAARPRPRPALTALGRPGTAVHRLGHPDNGIDEDRLAAELAVLLAPGADADGAADADADADRGSRRWCVVTWREDGHPDHEVVGRAAVRACAQTGARLVEYPIWMWHWAEPGDSDVPWERAVRLPLSGAVQARKRAAIASFVSQVEPVGDASADAAILPPHVVARFHRPEEVFFT